ncbi:hypothetical protein PC129_g16336 [Phytophthora cactorum]|uniref:Uncharacterized protein n=1 Tax=Phytophthora cactorum TaxID=29920 RepID=A0A8T1HKP6_9STRA|nr:hypothetical protein PC129_g16336 [Phytophthora cactorum]
MIDAANWKRIIVHLSCKRMIVGKMMTLHCKGCRAIELHGRILQVPSTSSALTKQKFKIPVPSRKTLNWVEFKSYRRCKRLKKVTTKKPRLPDT